MVRYDPIEAADGSVVFEYHDLTPPTPRQIYEAYRTVREHFPKTQLERSEHLSETLDADVYLKRDDTLPTGSFKVRGTMHVVGNLPSEFHEKGVITYSAGNHGQGVAYACRERGIPATVVVSENLENEGKIRQMERLGASVIRHGETVAVAQRHCERLAAEEGYYLYHPMNERLDVAGKASLGLEIVEQRPDVDVVVTPLGGGTEAAGLCLTVGTTLGAEVVGVQAEGADAAYRAWTEGSLDVSDEHISTEAEGIGTHSGYVLPMKVFWDHLDDMVRVSDEAIWDAVAEYLAEDHVLVEGAAAAPRAAAKQLRERLTGKTVVLQVSGRNLSAEKLRSVVERT